MKVATLTSSESKHKSLLLEAKVKLFKVVVVFLFHVGYLGNRFFLR